ncbi:MAG: chromosome segregation protein SMC, partial [Bdellovibrionaceae bacterium]|nr:chromosome segregation protein SMC [Pseudobdellovibrionaceae bacterium]
MRIKKLELIGFKSFKDRTVIQFDAGITGIVGPNGCGKSNIVDALTWVMGEMSAKHLRGSSMEDVIFAGAEGYAPMGLCEVSLTLENDGGPFPVQYLKHSEIMVTRRLHRSGESEYFVNKEPARLRDIQEIFMDTGAGAKGFSIIQQNMIGQMITAKAEDRRMLIEEAAGITKFKARKRESQRKLISTEQNLVRLHDIVNELKRQIDSLQRQAQRAERYRNLKREIEDLDLWLSSRQYVSLRETSARLQAELNEAEAADVSAQSENTGHEAELEDLRTQLAIRETEVADMQNRHAGMKADVQKKETELQELRFEIEQARRNKEMTGSLLQENQTRKEILEADLKRVQDSLAVIRGEAQSLRTEFIEKKTRYEAAQARIDEVDRELTDSRRELLTVSQGESSISARALSLEETIETILERESDARGVLEELLGKKLEFENRRNKVFSSLEKERQMQLDLSRGVETLDAEKKRLQGEIESRRKEVDLFKDNLNEVTSRLYGLENLQTNLEGFQEGVKSVMFWQRQRIEQMPEAERGGAARFQPVAEVVEVPAEFELAMESVLGPRLQMLVAESPDQALSAVDYLKEKKSGRSSFYPTAFAAGGMETVSHDGAIVQASGVRAVLQDVVRAPEKFKPVVQRILQGVAVVDSITSAVALRGQFPGWTFVTLEGDLVSNEGVITGGTAESADSGVLKRRREIKELSERKEEWSGKLALAQAALKKFEEQLKGVIEEFESAQKKRNEQELLMVSLKKDLERAENEFANASHAIERQEREVLQITQQAESRRNELDDLNGRLTELRERKAELETRTQELTEELAQVRGGIDEMQEEVTRLQVTSATRTQESEGLERQSEMLMRSYNDVCAQLERMADESEKSTQTMSSGQILLEQEKVGLERLITEVEELGKTVAVARDEYERLSARGRELEKLVSERMMNRNRLQARMNEAKLHLEQARMKEVYLSDQVRERYILNLAEVADRYKDREGDPAEAEIQLKDLREKIARIGDVNLAAIEEYDEVATRYEFLSKQQADLVEAKEQLKKVIDRINRICSKRFKDTFEQVNERFTKVFP